MYLALNIDCEMDQALSLSLQGLVFRSVRFHLKLVEDEEAMGKILSPILPFFLAFCPTIAAYSCFIHAP